MVLFTHNSERANLGVNAHSVFKIFGLNSRSVCAIWAFFAHSLDYYAAFVNMKDKYIHCLCCA